ncbi:unnamed protein product [Rotaria sp. Silwood2]|nr:unnamed protein product [Rotaria sp. Silwood2]
MIFDTLSPTDHMFESLPSSFIEHPLSDECNFSQIELSKEKMFSKRQENSINDMHTISNRYQRLKPSPINISSLSTENLTSIPINQSLQQIEQNIVTNVNQGSTDSLWQSSDEHHLSISPTKSLSITEFYPNSSTTSYSSSCSISSSDLSLINNDSDHVDKPDMKTLLSTSSSGYESSLNSNTDHFFPSSPDSILISNCNLVEQFIDVHLPKQSSFNHDIISSSASSLSSSSSSFFSRNLISTIVSSRTAGYCHSPLAKRTVNPRLLRSVLSCSVFEVDDEHEVVSSTTQNNVKGTREKSHIETFNCLRGNFTESLLHGKILPCGVLDGFTIKLGVSGVFIPKQVILPVTTFWFNVSDHQAASPYLGYINLQCLPKRGYHTPTKGTITLALLNPNGTAIHLFLILYDLSDMPPDHRTFIRQKVVHMPEDIHDDETYKKSTIIKPKENLRYLAHIRFVTSQTGKLYMHSDIRLIFARNKLDYDERTGHGKPQLETTTDMPTPKYWSRK